MIPGETCEPIELIFGRYLPLEGSYGAPKFWVHLDGIDQVEAIANKFGPNMSVGKENMPAKCRHDRPPTWELGVQNCRTNILVTDVTLLGNLVHLWHKGYGDFV